MSLFNALNPWDPGWAAEIFAQSPPLLDTLEIGPSGVKAPPLYNREMVSPSKTWQDTQFGQGASLSRVGQFPLRHFLTGGINQEGQPAGYYLAHTILSTSDLRNWKNVNSSFRQNLQEMADLITPIFATQNPNWTYERWLVINTTNEEAHHLF